MSEVMLVPASFQTQEIEAAMSTCRASMTGRHHARAGNAYAQARLAQRISQKVADAKVSKTTHFQRFPRALTKSCAAP